MSITNKRRYEVLKRDGFACQYCGKRAPEARLQVDHIDPLSNGGSDDVGNLITACFECNNGKRDNEFLAKQTPDLCEIYWLDFLQSIHFIGIHRDEKRFFTTIKSFDNVIKKHIEEYGWDPIVAALILTDKEAEERKGPPNLEMFKSYFNKVKNINLCNLLQNAIGGGG